MHDQNISQIAASIDLTSYLDYRAYLDALYQTAKGRHTRYSWEKFASDLGFAGTNVIRLTVKSGRRLADSSVRKIVRSLQLNRTLRRYFAALVKYNDARSTRVRELHFNVLMEIKQTVTASPADRTAMQYFTDWHVPVVREYLRLSGHDADLEEIARHLYIAARPKRLAEACAVLAQLNLARWDGEKVAEIPGDTIVLPEDATAGQLALREYHKQAMEIAAQAITDVPSAERDFNTLTLCLSRKGFRQLRDKIRALCREAVEMDENNQNRECVAQLNAHFFALTRPLKEDSK